MKDIQILWAACKYHWRRFTKLFKKQHFNCDDKGNYYYDGEYQHILYWRAYQSWQDKRYGRGKYNIGTDLFEAETNISDKRYNIKK